MSRNRVEDRAEALPTMGTGAESSEPVIDPETLIRCLADLG